MAKEVVWSRLDHSDKVQILDYWIQRNKPTDYSKRLNQLFEDIADLISKCSKIGKATEIQDIRVKVVLHYFFTHRETESRIEVLTIWDSRQDPPKFERVTKKSS